MTPAVWGTAACEFRMQARRVAVWLVLLFIVAEAAVRALLFVERIHAPGGGAMADWAYDLQMFAPAAFGCLLADRLPRDRRLRVDELLASLPTPPGAHLIGKYLGAAAATALPIVVVYALGWLACTLMFGPAAILPGLAAFAAVNVPGLLFVAAFSIGCPAVMPVPVYQFLFVGYWFWGNLLRPGFHIPTLSGTVLTPLGRFALSAFFGHTQGTSAGVPVWQGVASIAALLLCAALALSATAAHLRRRRAAA